MSLTRKLLKELELNDEAIERIIAAHVDTVDALRRERDEALKGRIDQEALITERDEWRSQSEQHLADLTASQAEYAAYRQEMDDHLHRTARRACLSDALRRFGANEHAIPLMVDALPLTDEDWNGDALADEDAFLNRARTAYAALFDRPRPLPTTRCTPPIAIGGHLTADDLRHMSPADINRNWTAVSAALSR